MAIIGYCVKCKSKRNVLDAADHKTSKDKPIIKGKCETCGTTVCVIGKKVADYK